MRYIISWTNTSTGERKTVTVHSSRAVEEVRNTLGRQPWRHGDIVVRSVSNTRFNDVIISFED